MTNNGWWVLLCMMLAFAPLGAEESHSQAAILAAFNSGNSSEALDLVTQAFAKLKPNQTDEATALIQSILAFAPIEQSGDVVVAAIKGNPALGNIILTAISRTSQVEQLTILSRVSFAMSQDPESFGSVSDSLPKLLNAVDGNVSTSQRLTSPDYNPSNLLSETGVAISPNRPDIRHDLHDLRQDQELLRDDEEQLRDDRQEHKGQNAIKREEEKIRDVKKDIKEDERDLRQDRRGN